MQIHHLALNYRIPSQFQPSFQYPHYQPILFICRYTISWLTFIHIATFETILDECWCVPINLLKPPSPMFVCVRANLLWSLDHLPDSHLTEQNILSGDHAPSVQRSCIYPKYQRYLKMRVQAFLPLTHRISPGPACGRIRCFEGYQLRLVIFTSHDILTTPPDLRVRRMLA